MELRKVLKYRVPVPISFANEDALVVITEAELQVLVPEVEFQHFARGERA